ncbi:MAG: hypothetical protein VB106_12475 [Clostridiaceae bacterium]|jgi:hypothetical protein|nr:hypothetical protein [Clostridiaceae bacterium]
MGLASQVKQGLARNAIEKGFSSRILYITPDNMSSFENELSSLLCYYHQKGRLAWSNIKLYTLEKHFTGVTGDIVFNDAGFISCEWPLYAKNSEEINIWGGMKADLLYLNNNEDTIALIENKIGSAYTLGNTQIDRYFKYLQKLQIKKKVFILLTSIELIQNNWYLKEIKESRQVTTNIEVYITYWEDILQNLK